ncbi:hypothetical protein [Novosphingopyxis sp. YJ-S2-01]|uniref:hypothetical protein n=1 Tax=Novosphingopyxis sp. YJ-S2-01 TaxID=2794021 RepID=UPI0018DB752C|nr:hypothetical protein [Novosphingopyxis sp. YJ-S2-01]MBH9537797.1 hypothetical protein [Novosphingopyxis sp. YJ-S2-01]
MKAFLFIAAAPILLASCARTVPVDEFEPDRSVAELAQTTSGPSLGASPSQAEPAQSSQAALNLQAVTAADFGGAIDPLQSCSFTSAADELLLVAASPAGAMERPRAVVRLPGGVVRLDGMRGGGYNYLTEGPAFQNQKGLTITIVRDDTASAPVTVPTDAANGEPVPGAVEANAQSWPATLTVITEQAEQQYPQGVYTCGI